MEYISHSLAETESIAQSLAEHLKDGDTLALYGDMGAGKTAFVRGLIKHLIPECLRLVHSPTFALVNEYKGESRAVYHFDFYRLKDDDDLYSIAFFDYFDRGGIIVTEWSENVPGVFPPGTAEIHFSRIDDETREIKVRLC